MCRAVNWVARLDQQLKRQRRKLSRRHQMVVSGAGLKRVLGVLAERARQGQTGRRRKPR